MSAFSSGSFSIAALSNQAFAFSEAPTPPVILQGGGGKSDSTNHRRDIYLYDPMINIAAKRKQRNNSIMVLFNE